MPEPKREPGTRDQQEKVIRCIENACYGAEVLPPDTSLGEWSRQFSEDHRGLVIFGNTEKAIVGNLYPGLAARSSLIDTVIDIARQDRAYLEVVVKNCTQKTKNPHLSLMFRACLNPMVDRPDIRVVPFVTSSWIIGLTADSEDLYVPSASALLGLATDLGSISTISTSKGKHRVECLDLLTGNVSPLPGTIARQDALDYFGVVLEESGEVDIHNLKV